MRWGSFLILLVGLGVLGTGGRSVQAAPEAGMLSGRVYDGVTLEPLVMVNVFLDSLLIGSSTGTDGKFVIRRVPPGSYRLVARRIGYEPHVEDRLQVAAGESVWRSISLAPTAIEAEEVVVTAARKEQTAQMAPASVSVLSAAQLRQRPIFTFDQALEMIPGISVHRSAGTSVQSLSIRGSSDVAGGGVGNRVLLMIDGRPALNSDSGGALWSLVPTNFIDRIEVVKGAFSSLYGSTAMGGVVNVITRRPAYRSMTTVDVGYGLYERLPAGLRYQEAVPKQSQVELSHSGQRGAVSYLFSLSRKAADGHAENTAFEFYNAFGKALFDIRRDRNLEFSFGLGTNKNDYPHTWLNNLQPFRVRPDYRDDIQKKKTYSADLLYWAVPSVRSKYSTRFYFYRHAARSFFNDPFAWKTSVDADKFGSLTQFDYYLDHRNFLVSGMDIQVDRVDSAPDTVMYGKRQVNNAALYLQDEIELTTKWTATLGLRYDWNHLVGGTTHGQLSPKFALVYQPRETLALRLLLGQAFRAPSIAERFFQRELSGGTLFKPNPGLKAESMDFSFETGMRWRLGSYLDGDLAYFRYHYRDMMYWVEISAEEGVVYTLFQVRNLNRALIQGVESSVSLHWRRNLRISLGHTYMDARDKSPGRLDDLLAYRVRHLFSFAADGKMGRWSCNLNGRYKSRVEEVFLYPREAPDAFFVANAKIIMSLSQRLSLHLTGNNLFETQYEELARYRMPGRSWVLGASMVL